MSNAKNIGAAIGEALGRLALRLGLGDAVLAHHERLYGRCRRCDLVLSGEAPDQICEPCHADEALAETFTIGSGGIDA